MIVVVIIYNHAWKNVPIRIFITPSICKVIYNNNHTNNHVIIISNQSYIKPASCVVLVVIMPVNALNSSESNNRCCGRTFILPINAPATDFFTISEEEDDDDDDIGDYDNNDDVG